MYKVQNTVVRVWTTWSVDHKQSYNDATWIHLRTKGNLLSCTLYHAAELNYSTFSILIRTLFTVSEGQKIRCGFDSGSWVGFWKKDRAAVRAVRTIQCNNLLFYLLFIILYNIYNILFIRPAVITDNAIAIRHPVTIIFIFIIVLPKVRIRTAT